MKIYTRTGDKGKTSLFDGTRVLKSNIRVESYGTIDELNSVIGLVLAQMADGKPASPALARSAGGGKRQMDNLKEDLENIQHGLFAIGSALATPYPLPVTGLDKRVKEFEQLIEGLTAQLPELKNFILPGGSVSGAELHVARSTARRAERQLVALIQEEAIDHAIVIYINRLSDLLFTMARFVNQAENQPEIKWKKK